MQITQILKSLQKQRQALAKQQAAIVSKRKRIGVAIKALGGWRSAATTTRNPIKRRKMSAAARRKIAVFQKARWAKLRRMKSEQS